MELAIRFPLEPTTGERISFLKAFNPQEVERS